VKVKVVVPTTAVLMRVGLQEPVMPFDEVEGSAGATEFKHNVSMGAKAGVIEDETVTSMTTLAAKGDDGVKV